MQEEGSGIKKFQDLSDTLNSTSSMLGNDITVLRAFEHELDNDTYPGVFMETSSDHDATVQCDKTNTEGVGSRSDFCFDLFRLIEAVETLR